VPAHDGEAEEQEGGGGDGTGPEGFSAAEQKVDEDQAREKLEGGGYTEGDAGGEVAILAEVVPGQGHEEGEDHADLAVAEYDPEREPADESAEEDGGEARGEVEAFAEEFDGARQGGERSESEEQLNQADVEPGDQEGEQERHAGGVGLRPGLGYETAYGGLFDLAKTGDPAVGGRWRRFVVEGLADVGRHVEREGGLALEPELGGFDILQEIAGDFVAEVAGGDDVKGAAEDEHYKDGSGEDETLEAVVGSGEVAAAGKVPKPEGRGGGDD